MATKNINDYVRDTGFGQGVNKTKFNNNGEMIHENEATQYDDLVGAVTGLKLYDTKGTVGFNYEEISLSFEPSGDITINDDCVFFNLQKSHAIKVDS